MVKELYDAIPESLLHNKYKEDVTSWTASSSEIFSMKSATKEIYSSGDVVELFKLAWGAGIVPRFAVVLWLLINQKPDD